MLKIKCYSQLTNLVGMAEKNVAELSPTTSSTFSRSPASSEDGVATTNGLTCSTVQDKLPLTSRCRGVILLTVFVSHTSTGGDGPDDCSVEGKSSSLDL